MIHFSSAAFPFSLCWILLALAGCQSASHGGSSAALISSEEEAAIVGEVAAPVLLPAKALGQTFVLRQAVAVKWSGEAGQAEEASFDAAVQRQGESLLLLGLGPMGHVGFTLKLEKGEVSFENRTGQVLPFAPDRMLLDVQRVYYPWLDPEEACRDCTRSGRRAGYLIEEEWVAGRLLRRRFESLSPAEAEGNQSTQPGIEVEYSGEIAFDGLPRDARLRDEGFGYEVELKTLGIDWID